MAQPFETLTSLPMPLIRDNVDTDQIIPSREMKSTGKTGLAEGLFAGWRYMSVNGREPNADFVMNDPRYRDSSIILAGRNFGCGSSREHAVWALAEAGFRAIIAESFAPIFAGNCVRNGIVPVALAADAIAQIAAGDRPVTVDLPSQQIIAANEQAWPFAMDAESAAMLREGLDAIDLTWKHAAIISEWQAADRQARPWVYLGNNA